jgi:hypothetical protein
VLSAAALLIAMCFTSFVFAVSLFMSRVRGLKYGCPCL